MLRSLSAKAVPLALLLASCTLPTSPPTTTGIVVDALPWVEGVVLAEVDSSIVTVQGPAGVCSGALLSPSVVLTARQCVSAPVPPVVCPTTEPAPPTALASQVTVTSWSSQLPSTTLSALSILVPDTSTFCDGDVAFIVLERPFSGVLTRKGAANSVASGAFVRTTGWSEGATGEQRLWSREHVAVPVAGPATFEAAEQSCGSLAGGVAIDEASGDVVGVLGRSAAPCDASNDVYGQLAPFGALLATAIEAGAGTGGRDAVAPKPISAVGEECSRAEDCATSACLLDGRARFCSRRCSATDACPGGARCMATGAGGPYCVPK